MRTIAIACGVLFLAGCTIPIPEKENAIDYGAGSIANASAPRPDSAPTPTNDAGAMIVGNRFPAEFQGRWGLVSADCTSTMGDNKGLMIVQPDRLIFYESRASVVTLRGVSPTEVYATLSFTGEGQEWTQETPMSLEAAGDVLTRFADGQLLRYRRCGA